LSLWCALSLAWVSAGAAATIATGAPAAPPPAAKPAPISIANDSVIAQVPEQTLHGLRFAAERFGSGFRAVTDLPALIDWSRAAWADPAQRTDIIKGSQRMALIAVLLLAIEWPLGHLLARRPAAGGLRRFVRKLAPIVLVAVLGNGLIVKWLAGYSLGRAVAFGALNAYVAVRLVMSVAGAVLSPTIPAARRVPLSDLAARRTLRFIRLLSIIGAFGFIGGEVAAHLGVSREVYESIQKLVALCIHLFLVVAVIRSRRVVAGWIRRAAGTSGPWASIGEAVAAVWPALAVTALLAWWLIWAGGVPGAYLQILRFVLVTGGILIASRLLGDLLRHVVNHRLAPTPSDAAAAEPGRLASYRGLILTTLRLALVVLTLFVLAEAWGLPVSTWFESGHPGERLGALLLKLGLLGVLTIVCWEGANALVERHVARLTRESATQRATRIRTLQPIVRIALIVTLGGVVIMTALSEIGINVGPLLAGAGIFGVALGFGSQKLVQDFITGIFLLVEDAMDVGDWVTVAGVSGSVEHLSIRTIRLRDGDGSVHLIPFSAVTTVTNTSRGVGNVPVSVSVRPAEDPDRVATVLADLVREIRADPAFGPLMQGDLQLWGVDKVDGSMTTIAGQIACTDGGRWPVQRELNRRVQKRFAELGIEFAIPRQSLTIDRRPVADVSANPAQT
jgi:small-conductance mechanosensitive channel